MSRTAIVTGGSRGIGLATARGLLELGHHVVITGRSKPSLDKAQTELAPLGRVDILVFDSSDAEATHDALAPTDADILIANVGMGFSGSVRDTSLPDWTQVLDTNVTSAFVAIKALLPGMLMRRWGRIVTVGSIASHEPIRYGVAYTASKHALLGLTRAVALDVQGKGVTANMVAPVFVRTDMLAENAQRIADASGGSLGEAEKKLASLSTLGRLIEPVEVAAEICRYVADETGELNGRSTAIGFDKRFD